MFSTRSSSESSWALPTGRRLALWVLPSSCSVSPPVARVNTTSRASPSSRVISNFISRPPLAHRGERLGQLEAGVEAWACERRRSQQEPLVARARRGRAQLVGVLTEEAGVRVARGEGRVGEHTL